MPNFVRKKKRVQVERVAFNIILTVVLVIIAVYLAAWYMNNSQDPLRLYDPHKLSGLSPVTRMLEFGPVEFFVTSRCRKRILKLQTISDIKKWHFQYRHIEDDLLAARIFALYRIRIPIGSDKKLKLIDGHPRSSFKSKRNIHHLKTDKYLNDFKNQRSTTGKFVHHD
jgi:hypothetical protein